MSSTRPELGEVLDAVLEAIAGGSSARDALTGQGIVVDEALIELPLEGHLVLEQGKPVLRTGPPATIMQTGFNAPVHRGRLHIVLDDSSDS